MKLDVEMLGVCKISKYRLLFFIFFIVLFPGYAFNIYGTASNDWFESHQRDSESLVVGRITPKSDAGLFANGGFLGWLANQGDLVSATYDQYTEDRAPLRAESYSVYTGQFGLQGYVLTMIDRALRLATIDGHDRLWLLQMGVAAALAATLAYLLANFWREFGLSATVCGLALLVFSPWLTVFARNLYWVPFTWFLPIAAAWHYYVVNPFPSGRKLLVGLTWINFFIIIKLLCGFEYITAITGATAGVIGYGLIKSNTHPTTILVHGLISFIAISLAAIGAIIIQISALAAMKGDLVAGWNDFAQRVLYRTYGNPLKFDDIFAASLNASIGEVLSKYWTEGQPVFNADRVLSANAAQLVSPLIVLIASSALYVLWRDWTDSDRRSKVMAISFLAISSLISSLSWMIVAKAHSYIHTHMNYVLWHVSFLLFAGPLSVRIVRMAIPKGIAEVVFAGVLAIGISFYSFTPPIWDGQAYATFETEKGKISIFKNGILFNLPCKSIIDGERFFLHVGSDERFLPVPYRQYGILNLDFSWPEHRVDNIITEKMTGRCRAFSASPGLPLNQIPVRFIKFGQFKQDGDQSRSWEFAINEKQLLKSETETINISDFSDYQWNLGINKFYAGFLVENSFENRQKLDKYSGVVINATKIPFEDIAISDLWITFFFNDRAIFPEKMNREIVLYAQ
ncbi:hypothetical protein [Brucella anthropi]|uniref:hypothetical protein n=1 Tax=Brucella anthropi TaxID=529 RepID=UPI00124C75F9|nr:hypothetical protein [Brucella anthropi]KAB2777285.1 hypothetical protein F9K99_19620 [Brucella anthropi]